MKNSNRPYLPQKKKIKTILGIFTLLVGVGVGVFVIRGKQIFRLGADESNYPSNIRVTNITEGSVSISWTTDSPTYGYIKMGQSQLLLDKTLVPEEKEDANTHYLDLEGLKENTKYFFTINSNSIDYYNEGQPYQFTTASKIINQSESCVIYGQVFSKSAQPQKGAIINATVGGGSPLSTITDSEGKWGILVSAARTRDLSSVITIDKQNSLIELEVLLDNNNTSSVTTYPQYAKPVPPIIIGRSYDYRQNYSPEDSSPGVDEAIPRSKIVLPL